MTDFTSLAPEDVMEWLTSRGWVQVSPTGKPAALWRKDEQEILLPLRPDAIDFNRRFAELLSDLAEAEGQSEDSLALDMRTHGFDVCEWRVSHSSITDGTIPLTDGEKLVSSVKTAVVAAAAATIHRRGYFGHSVPKRARAHASSVRMGQTRHGSYVVPIMSRVSPAAPSPEVAISADIPESLNLQLAAEPFGRQVMHVLASGIEAIHQIVARAGQSPSTSEINTSVGLGVSYELCSALTTTFQAQAVESLEVKFEWATRRPPPRVTQEPLRFSRDSTTALEAMTETLRESSIVADQTIVGRVRTLSRDENAADDDVVITPIIGAPRRPIRLTLPGRYRTEVTRAYESGHPVYVTGRLNKEAGRRWILDPVHDFGMAENLNLEAWERALAGDDRFI